MEIVENEVLGEKLICTKSWMKSLFLWKSGERAIKIMNKN